MRTLGRCLTWLTTIAAVFLLWMPLANAHPLGNFTINHYAGLQVEQNKVGIDYVLDMAEIPAFQEINQLDTNHNRKADPDETIHYPVDKCREVKSDLTLQVNHQPLALSLDTATVEFPPGVGGLATLRLTCAFRGSSRSAIAQSSESLGLSRSVEFEDKFYPQRLGWREITVTADSPIQGNFTASSITKRLTDYPTDLLSSPLNQRAIAFEINPSLVAQQAAQPPDSSNRLDQALEGRSNDAFTRLITLEKLDIPTTLLALAIAFLWGGLHALSPGHGKTIVGAYLVGSRGKAQHALFLGLTVTLTHTAGIFALGLVMLGTSQFVLTEQVYPWLSGLSGVLMAGIGLNLFISRLRSSQIFQNWISGQSNYHTHGHAHGHAHGHSHSHEQSTEPSAEHSHTHHDKHVHSHGQKAHSHLPPGADGSPITWSSILGLGISGGLLPCPSALLVLLSAIALGRIGFGLALVSAFSLGLAGVLTGIGLILVYARDWFEQLPLQSSSSKLLPAASALLMALIGLGITTKALFTHVL
jgi:nickel/cobalt transporter (NicO) family protein